MYVDPAASQMHTHKYTHILHNICTDAHTHTMAALFFISEYGNTLNTHQQGTGLISK